MSNRLKWGLGLLVVALAIVIGGSQFYRSIQQPYWEQRDDAIRKALAETALDKAESAERSVVDVPYMIVYGKDAEGREMIVWVGEEDVHAEYADEGRSRRQIERELQNELPNAGIERIAPGYWRGEYVWEAFYELKQDGETRHYYRYYRFRDGELLTTYTMSKE